MPDREGHVLVEDDDVDGDDEDACILFLVMIYCRRVSLMTIMMFGLFVRGQKALSHVHTCSFRGVCSSPWRSLCVRQIVAKRLWLLPIMIHCSTATSTDFVNPTLLVSHTPPQQLLVHRAKITKNKSMKKT